ncbi:MAG: type IV pilin protein [Halioglobus sp.]
MQYCSTKNRGFTLIEIMIVVAILGILVLVALPAYQQQILKTKRSLGKGELLDVLARQEQFYVNNKRYADTLDLLGYAANPYAIDADGNDIATTASNRIYRIELSAVTTSSFNLQAIPQLNQAKDTRCGSLQITSVGTKTVSSGATTGCW